MHYHVTREFLHSFLPGLRCILQPLNRKLCTSTVDVDEAEKFSLKEAEWWDVRSGPLAPLHTLNTLRVPFISDTITRAGKLQESSTASPLSGYRVLDIGCGGGILSEPLARLGATVVGIDPTPTAVTIATNRATRDPFLSDRLSYYNYSVEEMRSKWEEKGEGFDCVVASEVAEHVPNLRPFMENLCGLVKPGGVAIFTTVNKTLFSFIVAKMAAEYLTGVVPKGTHQWDLFVPPEELADLLEEQGLVAMDTRGMMYNVLSGRWYFVSNVSVNYCMSAVRNPS